MQIPACRRHIEPLIVPTDIVRLRGLMECDECLNHGSAIVIATPCASYGLICMKCIDEHEESHG